MPLDTGSLEDFSFAVVGSGGVGKSCLTVRFLKDEFMTEYDPTIEENFRKRVMLPSGYECVVNITDTAGQQEYTSLRDHQLRHAEGFLLVYSICDATSFDEAKALKEAIERVNEHQTVATPVVLVGNKIDLEADRQVSTRDASAYATELGIPFFETSAKTSHGVEAAFHALITELRKFRAVSNAPPSPEQAADLAQSSAAGSASAGAQGDLSASGSKSSSSGGGRRRGRRGQSGDKGSSSGGSSGKLCILV